MNYKKHNEGFTLIELIIALSIVSILSLAFFNILNSSIKYNTKNEKDIKALNIAQSEIENLRKEIKLSNSQIVIYDKNKQPLIRIPENYQITENNEIIQDNEIIWDDMDDTNENHIIKLNEDHQYIGKNLDGTKDINTLQYERTIEEDNTPYTVKLNLTRHKKGSKFLYNIEVRVSSTNKYFSKKETILNTSILSK